MRLGSKRTSARRSAGSHITAAPPVGIGGSIPGPGTATFPLPIGADPPSTVPARPCRSPAPTPRVQISTLTPISRERSEGRRKNRAAFEAFRAMKAKSFSRQIAMPGRSVARTVSRPST